MSIMRFVFLFGLTLLVAIAITLPAAAESEIPRPEHPNPQSYRGEWLSLNGEWEFGETNEDESERFLSKDGYPEKIIVPFCRESKLSGIGRREFVKNVWYRRTFRVPEEWQSPRIRLHVGACDWRTTVWVNGERVGAHTGGNVSFAFDITPHVNRAGENQIVIHAFDDTASGLQPLGKQSITGKSEGIFYTQTTGIWQSVWLEGVGSTFIDDIRVEPRPESQGAVLTVNLDGPATGLTIDCEVHTEESKVARGIVPAQWRDNRLLLSIPQPRLWSPEEPFLYHLKIQLMRGSEKVDELGSYFGMRKVSIDGNAVLLNDKPVFQRLVLDQGFYPDGIWTAPSDEALRRDIELSMAAGFNGARLHQKVFEPRFLYWADKLGYLVWGEYPSYGANYAEPVVNTPILQEWVEVITRDRNHPSIIGWCPFNETPPAAGALQQAVLEVTRQLDPSRPCIEASGWTHTAADPEILDAHDYEQNPAVFRERYATDLRWQSEVGLPERYGLKTAVSKPFMVSEYGGIGWSLDEDAWGYGNTPASLEEFHARFEGLTSALLDSRDLFGLCYTQLTDVEQEQNGLYHYDRSPKFETEKLRAVLTRVAAYEQNPPTSASTVERKPAVWTVLTGSVHDGDLARPWRYSFEKPGDGWERTDFDASSWPEGLAPFGLIGQPYGKTIRTKWNEDHIWLRQEFDYSGEAFDLGVLILFHDDDCEIWLNGTRLLQKTGWVTEYRAHEISADLRGKLKPGKNTLAVHVKQNRGGQFFDLALLTGVLSADAAAQK